MVEEHELFPWFGPMTERSGQTALGKLLKEYTGRWFSVPNAPDEGVFSVRICRVPGTAKARYRCETRAERRVLEHGNAV